MSRVSRTTGISAMLQKLSELFSARRAPAGYRPGVTLEHLRRNLGLAGYEVCGPTTARVSLDNLGLQLEIVERTESQLLMHLVMTEFVLRIPASQQGTASFELHHTGAVRRTGIRCRQRSGDKEVSGILHTQLQEGSALHRALMPLDFKRLRIDLVDHQWCVRLEHMGGSEVVNRMPAFRRYIPLSGAQRAGLLRVLAGLQRVLGAI